MRLAHEICVDFLHHVVAERVFSEAELTRGDGPLDDRHRRQIVAHQRIDTRGPKLARLSGKGGWSPDPARAALYAAFTNVSLLDHLLSVMRGALIFAAMDLAGRAEADLRGRLAAVAAVAFLHDADKMLEIGRSEARSGALNAVAVAGLMERFGIGAFLDRHGVTLSPAAVLELVNGVEVTALQGLVRVPMEHWHDRLYVRLADRVDGTFLQTRPLEGRPHFGVAGALHEIASFQGLALDGVRWTEWRTIELRDPHTPFLLDAFQAALSAACRDRHEAPPMIELHHDGRLVVVLPGNGFEPVVAAALGRVTGELGARIRVSTNARGKIYLTDAPGTVGELRDSIADMRAREREGVLRAGKDALRQHGPAIDAFLRPAGFLPNLPDLEGYAGQLVPLWTGTAGSEDQTAAALRDAVLIGSVLCCTDPAAKFGIPAAAVREVELRNLLRDAEAAGEWPTFLDAVPADTRRALLAGFAAGLAQQDEELHAELFGLDGLVALWLEGRDGRPGLSSSIDRAGIRLRDAVVAHYTALMAGQRVVAADEDAEGRCHFTNAPVPRTARIDGKTGLYGLKVSAFSGREGRPESFRSTASETLVSPVMEAEHKLRRLQFEQTGQSADRRGVPVAVTSPTAAGLFGALPFSNDADTLEFALSDVARSKVDGSSLLFRNAEAALRRTRVARFEELPDRMCGSGTAPGQIAFARMVLTAALRTGRPVHVFRGLPRQRPEFVAFDTLPQSLIQLLSGDAFRLEQLGGLIDRLKGIEAVAEATGFGFEVALRLCDPATRFGAACDVLARAERRLAHSSQDLKLPNIRFFVLKLLETDPMPTCSDTALLDFGKAMARVQRGPRWDDGDSRVELGLRIALDTVEALERMGQAAPASLVAGIAGELEKDIARKKLFVHRELRGGGSIAEVVEHAALIFVERVWQGAFGGVMPASRDRRVALAVYRHGFKTASRLLYASKGLPTTEEDDQAA